MEEIRAVGEISDKCRFTSADPLELRTVSDKRSSCAESNIVLAEYDLISVLVLSCKSQNCSDNLRTVNVLLADMNVSNVGRGSFSCCRFGR